ncbi:MAG: nuclear transport factor 2 family protein [SAR86 cluster bacterium]|nr:nuclear transport factor 2 family protein [SAR86 cluster bacterium]|tara:strand:- start:10497 stop:10973 length:477 start_codon:yes stop_codon:yes gene_type:complete
MQAIEARLEIESIMFKYTSSLDSGDLESAANIFDKGSIKSPGQFLEGTSGVLNAYKSAIIFYNDKDQEVNYRRLKCSPKTKHLNTNIRYSFNADMTSANVHSYFTVYQSLNSRIEIVVGGRYEDKFLFDKGWFLKLRQIYIDHTGDIALHIRSDIKKL